ncbi:MAG: WYL domain-containing protein [Firmicutes bacterium]|nr:WYL domain-containing protein [Bacillota bacterium]
MAKSSNQKLKLMYLAKILQEKTDEEHGLTMPELIEQLALYDVKAERKSIYDDMEALREQMDMDVDKRTEGGRTEYYLGSRDFELAELKLLVDAVQSSRFMTRETTEKLIHKIEGLTSVHQAKQLSRQVHVANRVKTMNQAIYTVDGLHAAISLNRQISFQYVKWNVKMEREPQHNGKVYKVSPWALMWDDENYYLVAFESESQEIRHYRVDRMTNLKQLNDLREGAEQFKNFDMGTYSRKTFGMYHGRDEHVTLRCMNDMADAIMDRFGQEVFLHQVDAEHFDVTVKVSISPVFLTWLMNFGGRVRIAGPQWVIDEQVKLARACIEQYE